MLFDRTSVCRMRVLDILPDPLPNGELVASAIWGRHVENTGAGLMSPPHPQHPTQPLLLSSLVLEKSPQPVVSGETTGPPPAESIVTEQQGVSRT